MTILCSVIVNPIIVSNYVNFSNNESAKKPVSIRTVSSSDMNTIHNWVLCIMAVMNSYS